MAGLFVPTAAAARDSRPSTQESFSVGTSGVLCEAQGVQIGKDRQSIFDRKWAIVCRDAGKPVGTIWAIRESALAMALVVASRDEQLGCGAPARTSLEGIGSVSVTECRGNTSGLPWRSYSQTVGRVTYIVEGIAGYDSALQLALRSIVQNRVVPGEVTAATIGSGDLAAINRARAAVTDPDVLVGQGYRLNNSGSFAEAAELFQAGAEVLDDDTRPGEDRSTRLHEFTVNRALQVSNLGDFAQAARLFDQARALAGNDPVQLRLSRNFEAIDALNRGDLTGMLAILDRPMPQIAAMLGADASAVSIDRPTAAGINSGGRGADEALFGKVAKLTVPERVAIIDAQASQLRGSALRLSGDPAKARDVLLGADAAVLKVRDGRVVSAARLRSQILSEAALADEAEGKLSDAEARLRFALALIEQQYPDSSSLNAARARLAGFMVRHGRSEEARTIYRGIVQDTVGNRGALVGMANLMRPYFDMLAADAASRSDAVADLFVASQLVERPGAADSLAQLARQLESGDREASALFRQSLALSRDIERNRIQIAQVSTLVAAGQADPAQLTLLSERQQRLQQTQLSALSALSAYPQFRAVSRSFVTLEEMRGVLRPGEAYLKLVQLGGDNYAVYVSASAAKAWKLGISAGELIALVGALRDSISTNINGMRETYPFDLESDLKLSGELIGPISSDLAGVSHLIFEPDGAMLQLPANLLTTDSAGVVAYAARIASGGDEFDFRGIKWLGRDKAISTALSAASFRDARKAPPSQARRGYLGMGQNLPLGNVTALPSVRGAGAAASSADCDWPASVWNRPVSSAELRDAASIFGSTQPAVLTAAQFTDSAIKSRDDLGNFRVVHFATHGLVSAPRPGCPAKPALLTSFGDGSSDGLLSFEEIFDLHFDADIVILSACDTAGGASAEATRAAGVSIGGGQALDGLVRAFIAAGGRDVIASHWPAPDDFGATQRLFTRFFSGPSQESVGNAIAAAQLGLMDEADTSHPFYWSGFAIVGDGARAVRGN